MGKRAKEKTACCSELPNDILDLIVQRLSPHDCLQFRAVCKSWRLASLPDKTPWVVADSSVFPKDPNPTTFFSPWKNKHHSLDQSPEARSTSCWGSSRSWLLLKKGLSDFSILNPISNLQIHLPPLPIFQRCPIQVALSTIPSCLPRHNQNTSDSVVMLTISAENIARFCKPGDKTWKEFKIFCCGYFHNLISYKGMFYVINMFGLVVACNLHENPPKVTKLTGLPCPTGVFDVYYLLKSREELFSVLHLHRELDFKTKSFMVFKLDVDDSSWIPVESLGDQAFFVAGNSSTSMLAEFSGFRKNSIYFAEDRIVDKQKVVSRFDLDDGSITRYATYDGFDKLWIAPYQ